MLIQKLTVVSVLTVYKTRNIFLASIYCINHCYVDAEKVPLLKLVSGLKKREIVSVFVEGGAAVLGSFVDERLIDKVFAFHAPIIVGGKNATSAIEGEGATQINDSIRLTNVSYEHFQSTLLTIGYV